MSVTADVKKNSEVQNLVLITQHAASKCAFLKASLGSQ